MVITDPPRFIDLEQATIFHSDLKVPLPASAAKVGAPFVTLEGEPGVIVNAATAHVVEVGLRELKRRRQRKQRAARATRRRQRS